MKRKKLFRLSGIILMAVALVVILLMAGCAKPAPAPPPAADKYGGVLKWRYDKVVGVFGYPLDIRGSDRQYANACLQRLLRLGEGGIIEPQLATSWELSPDKKSYTFHLRKGVKFHDGTDFNAEAVKYNLDLVRNAPVPTLSRVTSIDVVDDYTVRLNLSTWDNLILSHLALDSEAWLISPTALEKNGVEWAKTHPVGTGPFKLKSFERNISVTYERFDDYWEEGLPYLDGFEIHMIVDPMTALASLKAGEVHIMRGVDVVTASELEAGGYYDVQSIPAIYNGFAANTKDPNSPFADKRVRQALEYALDKETICESLGHGYVDPVYDIIPGAPEPPDKILRKYDPQKAKELLAEAGYPDGFKTKMIAPTFTSRDFVVAIQDYLARVGIDATPEIVTPPVYMSYGFQGGVGNNFILTPVPGGGQGSPLLLVDGQLASDTPFQVEMARTPGFDDLIEQAVIETDADKVIELLKQMEKLAYDDAMYVPFRTEPMIGAADPCVHDCQVFYAGTPDPDLTRAWLSKK